jgi:flavodoxin
VPTSEDSSLNLERQRFYKDKLQKSEAMNTAILYFSRTGNTKRFAEAIGEFMEAPVFDIATTAPSEIADFQLLFVGTPVIAFKPAVEVSAFVNSLPKCEDKKAVPFCTYVMGQGTTLKDLEKELSAKGYDIVLAVGKQVGEPSKTKFSDELKKIAKAMEKQGV